MHKFTFYLLLFSAFGFSQNIQFNDPDLLVYLTTRNCVDTDGDGVFDSDADFDNDGQIQISEAQQVLSFSFTTLANNIQDIGGFENFSNLEYLNVTTIDISSLDLSVWQSLQSLRLSSSIESFTFNNPMLTEFWLQNVGFNNPLFDLTNLPNLEYVRIQSNFLTDNLIFGTHNNLEELRIFSGTFSNLNLSGMPALKYLTIADFIGSSIDISNATQLEEFSLRYDDNLTSVIGADASSALEIIDFIQDGYFNNIPSNLDIAFNNQSLSDVSIRGANSVSISNNTSNIGAVELYFIKSSVNIDNSSFSYVNSSLDGSFFISDMASDQISFSNIEDLRSLRFQNLSTSVPFDLSTTKVENINFSGCSFTEINMKNGDVLQQFNSSFDTDIQFICIDSEEQSVVENGYQNTESQVVVHPYCTFVLGGEYYEITGDVLVDLGSGCGAPNGPVFDLQFTVTDGVSTDVFYSSSTNNYTYTLPEGNHVLSSQLLDLDYWTVSPESINLDFPTDGSPYVQDFCVTPAGAFNDLEIVIIPLNNAVPGFESEYKLVYKNKGTTTLSGSIDFAFNDDLMNFSEATPNIDMQTDGNLTWDYLDLLPFETREISFSMLLNTPTDTMFPLNIDDILDFTATINPVPADETENDNVFTLSQIVVNSFDPNDITCLQGDMITLEQVGEYVHYMIRFENNGTANAVNVVVKDILDTSKFDLNTIVPLDASHDFYTRVNNGNEVEFIFENIQLPFDDATNDGYVLFKIKSLPSLIIGDSFSNEAEIYFDFNFPILTNNATTTVVEENLSTIESSIDDISIFPNPAKDKITIEMSASNFGIADINIYDLQGKLILEQTISEAHSIDIDISNLISGIYFVKLSTNTRTLVKKLVIE